MNITGTPDAAITAPSQPIASPSDATRENYNPLVHGKPKTMAETAMMMALVGRLEDERFNPHWWTQGVNRKDRRRMKAAMRKVLGRDLYDYAAKMYWRMREVRGNLTPVIEQADTVAGG